jgi:hypothetical protein
VVQKVEGAAVAVAGVEDGEGVEEVECRDIAALKDEEEA